MLYERLLRPALLRLTADDPERAHEWAMHLLAALSRSPRIAGRLLGAPVQSPRLRRQLFGLSFPNPVGLAAGFDKNAVALPALAALGFGFLEAGTVTYHPQPGNPRPRIVRLPAQRALINRMGFNNDGAAAVARRLAHAAPLPVPLGISLGKSRVTPLEQAVEDYCASFRLLAPYADYIAVNVSSPNTPGLRALQERDQIDVLLAALQQEAAALAGRSGRSRPPLLVKLSPDLTDEALDELLEVCLAREVAGVIAVNTTVSGPHPPAPSLRSAQGQAPNAGRGGESEQRRLTEAPLPRAAREGAAAALAGGLSGRPLFPRALAVVRRIHQRTGGTLPVIGVGGIFTAADAYAMIRAGASLVQIYTGFIYEGPAIARRINRGLLRLMDRDGMHSIEELRALPLSPQPSALQRSRPYDEQQAAGR